jgi:phosphate transport system permease protein
MKTSFSVSDGPFLESRHRFARLWQAIFRLSTVIAVIALLTLLLTVTNQAFGLVVVENRVDPAILADQPLETLPAPELAQILHNNLTRNRIKTIERDSGALDSLSQGALYQLVLANVVQPKVDQSYSLLRSLFDRASIEAEAASEFPNGRLEFRAWLNPRFLENAMSPNPEDAGVRTALLGSLALIAITIAIAFPIGVGAAIYLEEYADQRSWLNRFIQVNIDNLAGVPSIVYGILGLAIFVRVLEPLTSGAAFGVTGNNGRTILSAGLTMALLILPILIINAQEAIRAVPSSLRQASYGLGATQWQTIWNHVLPYALPGILTGTILAVSRAIGETAPLIVIGASTYITTDPDGLFSKFTALPIQIYNWTTRPQAEFRNIAAAAILVLLLTLLSLNAAAVLLRNRFSRRGL